MEQNSGRLEKIPQDILEAKLKQKRFEMLTPLYGMFLAIVVIFGCMLIVSGSRSFLRDGLPYLPYGLGLLFLLTGLLYLRHQKFLEWERRFVALYEVGADCWLPSKVKWLNPKVIWLVMGLCLVGVVVFIKGVGVLPQGRGQQSVHWLKQGDVALAEEKYELSLHNYEQALAIVRSEEDMLGEALILDRMGRVYTLEGAYPQAVKHFEAALAIVTEAQDRDAEAAILLDLGKVYYEQGLVRQALDYLTKAIQASGAWGEGRIKAEIYLYMTHIHLEQGEYSAAYARAVLARNLCRNLEDEGCEGMTLELIGYAHLGQGNQELALKYFGEALEVAQSIGQEAWAQELETAIESMRSNE